MSELHGLKPFRGMVSGKPTMKQGTPPQYVPSRKEQARHVIEGQAVNSPSNPVRREMQVSADPSAPARAQVEIDIPVVRDGDLRRSQGAVQVTRARHPRTKPSARSRLGRPKSIRLDSPDSTSTTLCGFTSRCRNPRWCDSCTASANVFTSCARAFSSANPPSFRSRLGPPISFLTSRLTRIRHQCRAAPAARARRTPRSERGCCHRRLLRDDPALCPTP
jgi:hypothetical protein